MHSVASDCSENGAALLAQFFDRKSESALVDSREIRRVFAFDPREDLVDLSGGQVLALHDHFVGLLVRSAVGTFVKSVTQIRVA